MYHSYTVMLPCKFAHSEIHAHNHSLAVRTLWLEVNKKIASWHSIANDVGMFRRPTTDKPQVATTSALYQGIR